MDGAGSDDPASGFGMTFPLKGRVPGSFGEGQFQVQRRKAFIKKKHGDSLAKVEANHWQCQKGENDSRTFGVPIFLRSFVSTFFGILSVN